RLVNQRKGGRGGRKRPSADSTHIPAPLSYVLRPAETLSRDGAQGQRTIAQSTAYSVLRLLRGKVTFRFVRRAVSLGQLEVRLLATGACDTFLFGRGPAAGELS